ncbi:Exonuclease [Moritella sp. PE36]|uniref:lambda exonuclease family protein n=1 Tax=Moritella sp. PE36 TaxID=58051 RepID=UPI0001569286|nr:lambda exonuclease family protein [Moritella sp. PE36]EDM66168.1 Exonuclease [Moritella sp. PE36]
MIIHKTLKQGSDEWLKIRLGKITGSMVHNLMSNGRGGKPSLMTKNYMIQLIADKLTGKPVEQFKSKEMQWGNDYEDEARQRYEFDSGNTVTEIGFFELNDYVGYSPDGVIYGDGLLEIKCPKSTTQVKRFFELVVKQETIHDEYKPQIQFGLLVTGRKWCDFVSYDPRLPERSGYLTERVYRDEEYIQDMQQRIDVFMFEMAQAISVIQSPK